LRSLSAVPFSEKLPTWIQYSEAEEEALGGEGGFDGLGAVLEGVVVVEPAGLVVVVFAGADEGEGTGTGVDGFSVVA